MDTATCFGRRMNTIADTLYGFQWKLNMNSINTTRRQRLRSKRWELLTQQHGVTSQKPWIIARTQFQVQKELVVSLYQRNDKTRQAMYVLRNRSVRAIIIAVEKQYLLHILCVCVCSLRYPACNAHVP